MIVDPDFWLTALRTATPLIIAALGVLLAERSGVLFIGVEGAMLIGAFFAVLGAAYMGNPWFGAAAGCLTGLVAGLLLAAVIVWLPTDQVVMGLALNIAAVGLTSFLFRLSASDLQQLTPTMVLSPPDWGLGIPVVSFLFSMPPLAWLALILGAVSWYVLFRSAPGLLLRAVGHSATAARSAGINVRIVRTVALGLAGALAGLGGAALTVGWVRSFSDEITAGRGFIALAAVYFGRWHPRGAMLGCLLFGAGEAFAFRAQAFGGNPHFYLMIPYLLTVCVLAVTGRARTPQEVGRPYEEA